jgi:hypothetical protein
MRHNAVNVKIMKETIFIPANKSYFSLHQTFKMDFQKGAPNDYHNPPYDTKEGQPSESLTQQQQDLASHGQANSVTSRPTNVAEQTDASTKAPQSKLNNVDEDINSTEQVVDGYMDKKMGGANF